MDWTQFPHRHPSHMKIRELCKSSYDAWVAPPPIDQLTKAIRSRPKSYANIKSNIIEETVIQQLISNDKKFGEISPKVFKMLYSSITSYYYNENNLDISDGGDGMIVPTFVEIMHRFIFRIYDDNCVDLVNDADKEIYAKYFWAFELKCKLIAEHLIGPSKKAS